MPEILSVHTKEVMLLHALLVYLTKTKSQAHYSLQPPN